jgi:hypothetical protein
MVYKSLYIDGVKKEIFKYEVLYNEGHQRNIIEKLKKLKVTTFQTVEDIFRIEFPKSKFFHYFLHFYYLPFGT